jgi:hypothetical protein
VEKPKGKRPLERPRQRWMYNIKMDLGEVVGCSLDWVCVAQGTNKWRAIVNSVMNLRVP